MSQILQSETVRQEFRALLSPVMDLMMHEIYPYIYTTMALVSAMFLILAVMLVILVAIFVKLV